MELWQWIKMVETLNIDNSLKTPGTCEGALDQQRIFFLDERSLNMFKYNGKWEKNPQRGSIFVDKQIGRTARVKGIGLDEAGEWASSHKVRGKQGTKRKMCISVLRDEAVLGEEMVLWNSILSQKTGHMVNKVST